MLTQEDLQAIGTLIKAGVKAEIMETLVESNELNGQQLTDHKKRIELLEEYTGLDKTPSHVLSASLFSDILLALP